MTNKIIFSKNTIKSMKKVDIDDKSRQSDSFVSSNL
jgi:hypothetical protein